MATEKTPLTSTEENDEPVTSLPWYVCIVSACATLNSVNLGFDIGVNSGVGLLVQDDMGLTDWQMGVFMGSIQFVAAVGGLMSHEISDRLGRTRSFVVAQVIFLIGIAILCCAQTYNQLLLSRLFLGLAIGVSLALGPVYIGEMAPAQHRGRLTTWSEIMINVGILIGFIVNWVFADWPRGENWRIMVGCGAVLPCVMIVLALTVMPESPRWLIARGRVSEAEETLARTHPPGEDISAVVGGIRRQVEADAGYADQGWDPLLRPDAITKRLMMVGIGVAFAQQATGIESVVMYSPEIFKNAGVATTVKELFVVTILVGVVKTSCILIAACYLDSLGRRPMLLSSMLGMTVSHVLLSAAFAFNLSVLAASAVLLFVGFFSIGIGPVTWLFASEVFPLHIRAKAMSIATMVNRLASGTVALTFLPLCNLIGFSAYYLLFASFIAVAGLIQYFTVPETKGLTLEQVSECFAKDA